MTTTSIATEVDRRVPHAGRGAPGPGRRVVATRWPSRGVRPGPLAGIRLATLQALAKHWTNGYDWRKAEAKLNALPQFTTEIDGVAIHFIHIRSAHENTPCANSDPRLAGLGRRAARDRRSANGPDLPRRQRRGGVPPCPAVRSRVRLLGGADRARVVGWARRAGLARADAPPRLHALCRPGRGRRRRGHRRDGPRGARGVNRNPHEPVCAGARRHDAHGDRQGDTAANRIAGFRATGFGYFLEQATRPSNLVIVLAQRACCSPLPARGQRSARGAAR